MKVISCVAPYGNGGLGRHFAEYVEDARGKDELLAYFTSRPKVGDPRGQRVSVEHVQRIGLLPPLRFQPGWRGFLVSEQFDRAVARRVKEVETFVGFVGQSLHSFRAAHARGASRLVLIAPNSHVDQVRRQHRRARQEWDIERSWLTALEARKAIREYAMADEILVSSQYVWESFTCAGLPREKLNRFDLSVDPRYEAAEAAESDGMFRVVYVGSLTTMKGVPLLIEAFKRLNQSASELVLVGGWQTRAMRRYLERVRASDPRIQIRPGDPLPYLRCASVYVQPTFEDGFAYAAAEALACGVPVIVTEDTGAKELVRDGMNGRVVRTGSPDAIHRALVDAWEDAQTASSRDP